ncbi:MAG: AMP-binding protein [Bdellovibrionota bacterium]
MGELRAGAENLSQIFWRDSHEDLSFLEMQRKVQDFRLKMQGLSKGSLILLQDFSPKLTWILMLAAWNCDLAVLPLPPGASIPDVPWARMLSGSAQAVERACDYIHSCDLYILTSGSTGAPKAVGHTLETLASSARATIDFYRFRSEDSWLLSLDPSHIGGLQILLRVWLAGGEVLYWGEPKDIADALKHCDPSFLSLVPTQLFLLLENNTNQEKLRRSKAILLGGAKTQATLMDRARKLDLPVSITYGSSETASQISAFPTRTYPEDDGDVGKVLPIWVVHSTPKGLEISGNALFKGYFQNGQWLATGETFLLPDRGEYRDGHLHIEGRSDQIFQVGGENLSPSEILGPLEAIANLSDLMILTQGDDRFGHIPLLIIRSAKEPDIKLYLNRLQVLKPIKRPREIWWLRSDDVGKLSKLRIQTLLHSKHDSIKRLWRYEKL